jgi:two-component system response regulator AtoC
LAEYFRTLHERHFAIESKPLSQEMVEYLQNADWPGNVRELSNGMARHVLIGPEAALGQTAVPERASIKSQIKVAVGVVPLKRIAKAAIQELERNVILNSLRAHQWNRRKTAVALQISYRALIYKIRDAGLTSRRPARAAGHAEENPSPSL